MSRILIVDDDPAIRGVIRRFLEPEGHAVVECADGQEALSLLELAVYDLVITDLNMPGIDGFQLIRILRKQPRGPRIIMMSAAGRGTAFLAAELMGAAGTISKPFQRDELLALVQKAVESAEPEGS